MPPNINKPRWAFVATSWVALFKGFAVYLVDLWNATLATSDKGFYTMS